MGGIDLLADPVVDRLISDGRLDRDDAALAIAARPDVLPGTALVQAGLVGSRELGQAAASLEGERRAADPHRELRQRGRHFAADVIDRGIARAGALEACVEEQEADFARGIALPLVRYVVRLRIARYGQLADLNLRAARRSICPYCHAGHDPDGRPAGAAILCRTCLCQFEPTPPPEAPTEDRAPAETRVFQHRPGDAYPRPERYVLGELLGAGGMGLVFRVGDRILERDLAVKVASDRVLERSDLVERFLREARVTSLLEHPGVVPVFPWTKTELAATGAILLGAYAASPLGRDDDPAAQGAAIVLVAAWAVASLASRQLLGLLEDRHRLETRLRLESRTDALTGFWPAACLSEQGPRQANLALRTGGEVAAIAISLDAFLVVLEDRGHEAAERCLREVADRIRGCLGEHEMPFRVAGDDFLVLSLWADRVEAEHLAWRIREATEARPLAAINPARLARVSIGVAWMRAGDGPGSVDAADGFRSLIQAADGARHRARRSAERLERADEQEVLVRPASLPAAEEGAPVLGPRPGRISVLPQSHT